MTRNAASDVYRQTGKYQCFDLLREVSKHCLQCFDTVDQDRCKWVNVSSGAGSLLLLLLLLLPFYDSLDFVQNYPGELVLER